MRSETLCLLLSSTSAVELSDPAFYYGLPSLLGRNNYTQMGDRTSTYSYPVICINCKKVA